MKITYFHWGIITREENSTTTKQETRQKLLKQVLVLDLDDDDLVRRPRVGHVATQTVGVRKNRQTVANSGLHGYRDFWNESIFWSSFWS